MEEFIEKAAGKAWLNSSRAKELVFGGLCGGALGVPPDAIVISTAVDDYRHTAAFDALPRQDQKRIATTGHPRDYPQYFEPQDALMAIAQTPVRVCLHKQKFEHGLLIGEPEVHLFMQAEFNGRLKMFGVEPPREVIEALEKLQRTHGN